MEIFLDKIMHRRGNTLTYEKALRLEGVEDSPDILAYWIKIDDKQYKGKKEGSKKFDEIAVEEGGEVVVDYLQGKEVQRKNLSKKEGGFYSIDCGVLLLVRWMKKRPTKMKVGISCTQTRFNEGISVKVNLTFKSLEWREFTSLASQNLIRKQDLWGN